MVEMVVRHPERGLSLSCPKKREREHHADSVQPQVRALGKFPQNLDVVSVDEVAPKERRSGIHEVPIVDVSLSCDLQVEVENLLAPHVIFALLELKNEDKEPQLPNFVILVFDKNLDLVGLERLVMLRDFAGLRNPQAEKLVTLAILARTGLEVPRQAASLVWVSAIFEGSFCIISGEHGFSLGRVRSSPARAIWQFGLRW